MERRRVSFLFDLDGTLVDSVYQHVLAWDEALRDEAISLSIWRIHRKIGMSGGLLTDMLLREIGVDVDIDSERIKRLQDRHASAYGRRSASIQPLPGARELLSYLTHSGIPWAIASSGRTETARLALQALDIELGQVPIITRDQVEYAKPDPDLFLAAAAALNIDIEKAWVVGDSVWDMLAARRARSLGIGFLAGGYGREELERAGAYQVYEDPADLLRHIDEVGARRFGSRSDDLLPRDTRLGRRPSGKDFERLAEDKALDDQIEDSFPASDPPSYNVGSRVGTPARASEHREPINRARDKKAR